VLKLVSLAKVESDYTASVAQKTVIRVLRTNVQFAQPDSLLMEKEVVRQIVQEFTDVLIVLPLLFVLRVKKDLKISDQYL